MSKHVFHFLLFQDFIDLLLWNLNWLLLRQGKGRFSWLSNLPWLVFRALIWLWLLSFLNRLVFLWGRRRWLSLFLVMPFLPSFRAVLWRWRWGWLLSLLLASLLSSISLLLRLVLAHVLSLMVMSSDLRLIYRSLGCSRPVVIYLLLLITLLSTRFATSPANSFEAILHSRQIRIGFISILLPFIVSIPNGISLVSLVSVFS